MHELWHISIVLMQKKCIQIGILNNKFTILHIKTETLHRTEHTVGWFLQHNQQTIVWNVLWCNILPLGANTASHPIRIYWSHLSWLPLWRMSCSMNKHRLNTVSSHDAEWQGSRPYLGIRTALHSDPQHHRLSAKLIMQNTARHEGHILVTKPTLTMHFMFWNIYFKLTLSAALHRGQTSGAEICGDIESPLPSCFVYVPSQHS